MVLKRPFEMRIFFAGKWGGWLKLTEKEFSTIELGWEIPHHVVTEMYHQLDEGRIITSPVQKDTQFRRNDTQQGDLF